MGSSLAFSPHFQSVLVQIVRVASLLPLSPPLGSFLQEDVRGEAYQELLSPRWGNVGWAVVSGLASCCHHLGVRRAAGLEGEPAGIATVPGCHDRGFLAASLQLFCVPSRWKQLVAALAVVTGVVQFVVAAAVVGSCVCFGDGCTFYWSPANATSPGSKEGMNARLC